MHGQQVLLFCCSFTGLNARRTVRWLSLEVLSFKVVLPNCDSRGEACLFSLRDSSRTVACECFGVQRGLVITRLKIDAI